MIDVNDINELISQAKVVCETIMDMPSGCDGCWLFDDTLIDEDGNFNCPLHKTIKQIEAQME